MSLSTLSLKDRNEIHFSLFDLPVYQCYLKTLTPCVDKSYIDHYIEKTLKKLRLAYLLDFIDISQGYFYYFLFKLIFSQSRDEVERMIENNINDGIQMRDKFDEILSKDSEKIDYRGVFEVLTGNLAKRYKSINYPKILRYSLCVGMNIDLFEESITGGFKETILDFIGKESVDKIEKTLNCRLTSNGNIEKRNELLLYNDMIQSRSKILGKRAWREVLNEKEKDIEAHTDTELETLFGIKKKVRRDEFIALL